MSGSSRATPPAPPPLLRLRWVVLAVCGYMLAAVAWLTFGGALRLIVRGYEYACGAFLVGAILGALQGTGTLSGAWYGAARLAHLHATVLGWGRLTLLATVVFFGPTLLRTRMIEGADATTARAVPAAAAALLVAVSGLLAAPALGWLRPVVGGAGSVAPVLLPGRRPASAWMRAPLRACSG